tara:strand:- start:5737 stop:6462 length:726 start_codon:yes stop_codon:yes gene_type:complete
MSNTVSTKEKDYLETDDPLRNQNYCCLSFINPEEVIVQKESYFFSKFIEKFSTDLGFLIDNLKLKYKDDSQLIDTIKTNHSYIFDHKELDEQYKFYIDTNNQTLEDDFHKIQDFRTTIRGIKIRGVFNTVDEARNRCEQLKKKDNKFNIYVAEVGTWIPMTPNLTDIPDQEWSETQLNTLMMNYNKNKEAKDLVFDERSKNAISGLNIDEESPAASGPVTDVEAGSKPIFDDKDPWLNRKD